MRKLIYSAITSLDGYIEDRQGRFDWAVPDEEVHAYVNSLMRPIGTYLYGRRMYETMKGWESDVEGEEWPAAGQEFAAIWRAAKKIVYSKTLEEISTAQTELKHHFDPSAIRHLKDSALADISVAGPSLAAAAFAEDLVDECHLFINPITVGTGKPAMPTETRVSLELLDHKRFDSGVVYHCYRVAQNRTPGSRA